MKILSLLLVFFTLLGCSENSTSKKQDKDILRVGMELKWPPFETIDNQGNAKGISVDLAYELGEFLGREVEIVDTAFGSLIPALETNKIDIIIASMSITEERRQKINFSQPYFYFSLVTLVNKESGIDSREALFSREGLRFVGPRSFVALTIPQEKANNPTLREFDDKSSAVLEVVQGKADAFIIDPIAASEFNMRYPNETNIIWEPVQRSPIGMGVRKGDEILLKEVNEFINELEKNAVYKRLEEKYNSTIAKSLPNQTLRFFIDVD